MMTNGCLFVGPPKMASVFLLFEKKKKKTSHPYSCWCSVGTQSDSPNHQLHGFSGVRLHFSFPPENQQAISKRACASSSKEVP